ncbi:hypothetical protein NKH77_55185 [Streptomyces sp. M19]
MTTRPVAEGPVAQEPVLGARPATAPPERIRPRPDEHDDATPVRVTGPRLTRLVEDLAAADETRRAALVTGFWTEVERLGTPLVEELEGEPGHRAVTFLWRGALPRSRSCCSPTASSTATARGLLLTRVPGTDVWHLGCGCAPTTAAPIAWPRDPCWRRGGAARRPRIRTLSSGGCGSCPATPCPTR